MSFDADAIVVPGTGVDAPTDVHDFERQEMARLLRNDRDFVDIVLAFEACEQGRAPLGDDPADAEARMEAVAAAIREREGLIGRAATKRAGAAVGSMKDYTYDGAALYRRVYDEAAEVFAERVVIPEGGLKALTVNGRKHTLPVRRRLLLEYHDSEAMGCHTNERDTLMKLREVCWWPGMDRDVQRWVRTCHTCRSAKHQSVFRRKTAWNCTRGRSRRCSSTRSGPSPRSPAGVRTSSTPGARSAGTLG